MCERTSIKDSDIRIQVIEYRLWTFVMCENIEERGDKI